MKMFEYMAHGKAIVASDLPALREILNDGNSMLVDPESPGTWISAIRSLADPDKARRLGLAAKKDFDARHTWRKRAEAILESLGGFGNGIPPTGDSRKSIPLLHELPVPGGSP